MLYRKRVFTDRPSHVQLRIRGMRARLHYDGLVTLQGAARANGFFLTRSSRLKNVNEPMRR